MSNYARWRGVLLAVVMAAALMVLLVACTGAVPMTPEVSVEEVQPTAVATIKESTEEAAGDQATLIVQLDDERTLVRKLDLTEPISGLALLEQSDLDVVKADFSWGTAVCSIEGVGCPAEDCFCSENTFWNYLSWNDDAWVGYPVGPAQSVISTTDAVEGWQWGMGDRLPLPPARAEAAHDALTWLRSQQVITDGSYGSSVGASVETLLALGANHEDADAWRPAPDAPSLLDFVLEHGAEHSQGGVSEAGKLAVALAAADACWPAGAMKPSDYYSPTLGALHSDAGFLAWGILGTLALDEPTPTDSVEYLINLALPEGGWEWTPGWGRDTNSTALALQALVAAGTPVTNSVIISGLGYLQEAHTPEGGFSYDPLGSWGNVADANSTAYVLQALAALGLHAPDSPLQAMGDQAIDFLIGLQVDGGALGWQVEQPAPNLGATQQAIPALLGQPYPIRRVALPVCGE
ncbi:MAG: hypothetical protein IT328_00300 [Caldilineaceae bacterium]|nr:hypothetical protein [Caldilineaceae bacterium]